MNGEQTRKEVRQFLSSQLESLHLRKTPERFAVLDAVYILGNHFTLDELSQQLATQNFRVSRATLYNTLNLFKELRLVRSHHILGETRYDASYSSDQHCHRICTHCGKVIEIRMPDVVKAIGRARLSRFRKEGFSLYVYGTCNACQNKLNRQKEQIDKH
ncbi:MAG: transcriptional repressor [Prevotella sp.]|nr:transcriptional repressor [Prevotella sp.]